MFRKIKDFFYFPVAHYFAFFAKIRFKRWNPRVIVVTGSSGKTTLLHMIEAQLGHSVKYAHHANSSYGIPFDILDLKREKYTIDEWIPLILKTPINAFKKPPVQNIYIAECDTDRPYEGQFLSKFLKPEVTLWVSVGKTHSANFDDLIKSGKFQKTEDAVAYEFGHFAENTSKLVIANGDSEPLVKQLSRTKAKTILVSEKDLKAYVVNENSTEFKINNEIYKFDFLLPKESYYAIAMTLELLKYLQTKPEPTFSRLQMPPARSSVFKGIKNTTIIDSTYNAYLGSMTAILKMYEKYPSDSKWAVLADMIEQGEQEKVEHEKLARLISKLKLNKIILMGPRMKKYVYPALKDEFSVEIFDTPPEVLEFLQKNIKGGETILFKGARFLEGVIENLLANKEDVKKLGRREKIWEIRRKKWGL